MLDAGPREIWKIRTQFINSCKKTLHTQILLTPLVPDTETGRFSAILRDEQSTKESERITPRPSTFIQQN